jgi:hypothetical protein
VERRRRLLGCAEATLFRFTYGVCSVPVWVPLSPRRRPQDDDCSGCTTYLNDYHAMQAGIWASSNPSMFLSIEGGPPPNYTDYSNGGHGQCVQIAL